MVIISRETAVDAYKWYLEHPEEDSYVIDDSSENDEGEIEYEVGEYVLI